MKKTFISLLFLILIAPVVFAEGANWPIITGLGLVIAITILALMYALGHGFNINELKVLATEEFYQVLVTIVILGGFTAISSVSNEISSGLSTSLGISAGSNMQDAALQMVNENLDNLGTVEVNIRDFATGTNREGSKSAFCALMGTSINIAGCGAFRQLSAPVAIVSSALSVGAAELQSLSSLLSFGQQYALTFLLPLGVFLRSFKFTRGAGGLFLGLAIALYLILPIGVVFMQQLTASFENSHDTFKFSSRPALPTFADNIIGEGNACDAFDIDSNEDTAKSAFNSVLDSIDFFIYFILIKINIVTVISLLIMVSGLRAAAGMFGVDVDVSSLAKIA